MSCAGGSPHLRNPVLVAGFEGWNDAGEAASFAARFLSERWDAEVFAEIDPEDFFDFTATRPQVRLDEGMQREIVWPSTTMSAAAVPGGERDVIFLIGPSRNCAGGRSARRSSPSPASTTSASS